jgi:hypothetical protein
MPAGIGRCVDLCEDLPKSHASLPPQDVDLTRIWPTVRVAHQLRPHRVISHVKPLLLIGLLVSQKVIEELSLPGEVDDSATSNLITRPPFPRRHEPTQTGGVVTTRTRKEVDVIGHDHISTNQPLPNLRRNPPCLVKDSRDERVRQHPSAVRHTARQVVQRDLVTNEDLVESAEMLSLSHLDTQPPAAGIGMPALQ